MPSGQRQGSIRPAPRPTCPRGCPVARSSGGSRLHRPPWVTSRRRAR